MHFINKPTISKSHLPIKVDFVEGAIILIDKPIGWTSFDVVNKLRFKLKHGLGIKKIKVGHAGTLDPMATGLLLVCTGKMTKEIDSLQAQIKGYTGSMLVGATTPTYDAESAPDHSFDTDHITEDHMIDAVKTLTGTIQQIPPIYSAIKIDGKAAYELARRGKELEMKSRSVEIFNFELLNRSLSDLSFSVTCSKGTYIRSLVYDFGRLLHSGAYMTVLRRVSIGTYSVDEALSIDAAAAYIESVCDAISIQ